MKHTCHGNGVGIFGIYIKYNIFLFPKYFIFFKIFRYILNIYSFFNKNVLIMKIIHLYKNT